MLRISRSARLPAIASSMLAALICAPSMASAATQQELEARMQAMSEQLEAMKAELAQLKAQQAANAPAAAAPTAAVVTATELPNAPTFFGYGELNLSSPRKNSAAASADVGRFVIGMGYRFDDKTRLVSELEIEHAVSSASDPGEVEVEQAYIERDFSPGLFAKIGLFLVPMGLLNENHEPTRYYGVFRNSVETAIIPTTWREGGVALQGNSAAGLRWDVGLTTGFDLSKWDATSTEGADAPLASIHQELALARASQVSGFVAVNYTGMPGLRVGASLFTGGASQKQPGFDAARVTLWDAHAAWTPGKWDLAALYARGHISNTAPINLTLIGNPTLIPRDFYGWYGQAAYRLFESSASSISPFVRYERLNTGSRYADVGAGLTPAALPSQRIVTGGVNWVIAPGVVLKADYVDFSRGTAGDRYDIGVGYQF
jgi:hypothetical protein